MSVIPTPETPRPPRRSLRPIHPKTSGGTLGASIGIALVALVNGQGGHIGATDASAISTLLAVAFSWLAPGA